MITGNPLSPKVFELLFAIFFLLIPVAKIQNTGKHMKGYDNVLAELVSLLESARKTAARSINTILTATYWEVGRRIVEYEQGGRGKAEYGEQLVERLSKDLTEKFGRGFGRSNLFQMRSFYLAYPTIIQTASGKLDEATRPLIVQTPSAKSSQTTPSVRFPLPWSHYVLLLSIDNPTARSFYEQEALRGGWSVRQLERQITTQFYERTLLSKNKVALLKKGAPGEPLSPEEEIKDPYNWKSATARVLRNKFKEQIKDKLWRDSFWSNSYCLITTGQTTLNQIKKYVENQGKDKEL